MPRRFSSVTAKLTGATVGLVALVTICVYLKLASYQRENLLQSKEAGTAAVTRLFADSCAAALVFNDPSGLRELLTALGNNPQVEYAAVWDLQQRRIGSQLAELRRGQVVELTDLDQLDGQRREKGRIVSISSVRDLEGRRVGVVAVAFSLARENQIIADIEHKTLIVSSALASALALLIMVVVRFVIVRPLGVLAIAASRLEAGAQVKIDISSDDEVGRLAGAFRSMSSAIVSREERISARNRDMRLVLDNVGQGFVTLDINGTVSEERSRIVDDWFGAPAPAVKIWDFLCKNEPSVRDWFEVMWLGVQEEVLPLDLCLDQLPKVITTNGQTFDLAYRPILGGERLAAVIVVITDMTARKAQELAERRQRETMNVFRRIVSDRAAFDEFLDEAGVLVTSIVTQTTDHVTLKRQVHTLKGNCALYGLDRIAELCHSIEDDLGESRLALSSERAQLLTELWSEVVALRSEFAGNGDRAALDIGATDFDALLRKVRAGADRQEIIHTLIGWSYEPASKRLSLIAEQVRALAVRLGKAEVEVNCLPTPLRLPPRKWATFWSLFTHLVRNSVDHGIETSVDRARAGKPPKATVTLSVVQEHRFVAVRIQDDGRGVDYAAVAAGARGRGLPADSERDLQEALFADGVSARTVASATSGRGVGMGAVREYVRSLGGDVELTSQPGLGTTVTCTLPLSMLSDEAASLWLGTDEAGRSEPINPSSKAIDTRTV